MTWEEIRALYPDRWVIIEALDAFTENGHRVVSAVQFHGEYGSNWRQAWEQYKALHKHDNQREYYVFHTSREKLDIGVIDAFWRVLD